MSITRKSARTLAFLFVMAALVFTLSSCNDAIDAPYGEDAVEEIPLYDTENTYGVEVKPPVAVKDNSAELADAEDVVISSGKTSGYVIIYGSFGSSSASSAANELSNIFYMSGKANLDFVKDSVKETEKEILIGKSNRALATELADLVDAASDGGANYAWGYAVRDGKLAIYASSSGAYSAFCLDEIKALFTSTGLTVKEGLYVVKSKNIAEYNAEREAIEKAEAEANYKRRLENAKAANAAFTLDDFGGSFTEDLSVLAGKSYPAPDYYPNIGEHPRVNINADMLPDVEAALKNSAFLNTTTKVKELADREFDGKFPDIEGKTYNYGDGSLLGIIEAKAFMYLMTGDELYGYEAIVAVKNAMLTMVTNKDQFIDPFRAYGLLMMIAAETYDWCNDLMTEADKQQFLAGIEHKVCLWDPDNGIHNMEIGFPPTRLNGTNGHGTSVMLMRDYLSFAAAIYDDYPEWWNFIAGRFYAEFIQDFDYYFQSGMIHQGTACYAPNKLYTYLWSCWIIQTLGGDLPFKNDIDEVCLSLLGHMMPNGRLFETGDGTTTGNGTTGAISYQCCLMSAALFKNESLAYYGYKYSNSYSTFTYGVGSNQWTPVMSTIFLANGVTFDNDAANQMPLVQYNDFPLGQIVVRNEWKSDAAAVFMKIGELNAGNHDHKDSGTFQIYYKGLLSGTSGCYDGDNYGNTHWAYYNQATVSKNGLLVFDPARSASEPIFNSSGDITNAATFLYTGSQRPGINYDIVAKQTAVSYGYKQDGSSVEYAYIAGELQGAYDATTVRYMERNMLTVYTDDPTFPMFFFVYDDIISRSETHIKKFLLHTTKEAVLSDEDGDGKNETVTTVNEQGKLVLTSLLGNGEMTAIGGEGHAFEINGFNLTNYDRATETWSDYDYFDKNWGRVEISTTGSLESELLNVIYVTDANENEKLTPKLIENEKVAGAAVENVAAIFTKGTDKVAEEISFTVDGDGLINYYVTGLRSGTWKVYADGEYLGTTYATEGAAMVKFRAPAGTLTLVPSEDILPANAGTIRYEMNGGTLPEGAPDYYLYDVENPLPTSVTRGDDDFLGWFEDAELTKPITSISGYNRGPVTVYAKYRAVLAFEDYNVNNEGYKNWVNKTDGDTITPVVKTESLASMKSSSATFIFKLAVAKDAAVVKSDCRLSVYNSTKCSIFTTTSTGEIKLHGSSVIADLSKADGFVTIRIVADFENSVFIAYDEDGNVTHTEPMGLDGMTYKALLTEQIFNWRANSAGTILVDEYKVIEGNIFKADEPSCDHVDADDDEKCDECNEPFDDGIDLEGMHRIEYVIDDSVKMPDGYPKKFTEGEEVVLPIPAKEGYKFIGWYTDAAFTNPTATVPASATDTYTVYPKFARVMADMKAQSGETPLFYFNGEGGKATATYGAEGSFVLISSSGDGPNALMKKAGLSYAQMTASQASIIITLSKNADDAIIPLTVRSYLPNKAKINFFTTSASGTVKFGSEEIGTIADGFVTVRIVVDFANSKLYAYDNSGNVISERDFTFDQVWDGTGEDYRAALTAELFQIRVGGAGSIKIGEIGVFEGNIFNCALDAESCSHYDKNDDGKCDKCSENYSDGCDLHRDADDNGKCDSCNADFADGDEKPEELYTVVYKNEFNEVVSGAFNYPYDPNNVNTGADSFGGFWIGEKVSARVEASGDGELLFQTIKNASNTSGGGPNFGITSTNPSKVLENSDEKTLTYTLKLKRAADESAFMPFVLRIGDSAVAMGINSSTGWLGVISTNASGEVFIGGQKIATVGYSVIEIRVAVDFERGIISAYDEQGKLVEVSFSAPSSDAYKNAGIENTSDWLKIMKNQLFQIRTMGAGTVIYDEIAVYEGNALS